MKTHTVRSILSNAFELRNAPGAHPGTTFTALVIVDGHADAIQQNTTTSVAIGLVDMLAEPALHKFAIKQVTVSQFTPDVLRGLNLFALVDHSSSNFWADKNLSLAIGSALATTSFLMTRIETSFIY